MKIQQNKKLGKCELLFNELNEYVTESLNESIPLTTNSVNEKIVELDPSKSQQYKNLQNMVIDLWKDLT